MTIIIIKQWRQIMKNNISHKDVAKILEGSTNNTIQKQKMEKKITAVVIVLAIIALVSLVHTMIGG